ncbi:MAG: hypothetical protein KAU31_12990 [Spirochaetaceae bacterium]|nr:hypothetical protein [Spirochaetaceae bacterium]
MEAGEALFLRILRRFDGVGVLQDLVLIGSWVLPVYRHYFEGDPRVPVLRTTDIDILVRRPPRIKTKADIPAVLAEIGLEPVWSPSGDHCKFVHPEIEVEFLTPELGRGDEKSLDIPSLLVKAQPLRYLGLAADNTIHVTYHGLDVRVPSPEAFLLLKFLVIPRRSGGDKIDKDIRTARELGTIILETAQRSETMLDLFLALPKGWQKSILKVTGNHFSPMNRILREGLSRNHQS